MLGVLAEKAKTTPDAYPMSLNGIATGCNQKSNRDPLMQLEPDDVAESLERLRQMGAVGMVEGYGRVTKYRHYLYDWLGIEKIELSVMTELLLRGAQTEGELRGRVSRMDPVPDLPALRTLLTSLEAKGLVLSLTPEGRGHVVTHALYTPRELEHLQGAARAWAGGGVSARRWARGTGPGGPAGRRRRSGRHAGPADRPGRQRGPPPRSWGASRADRARARRIARPRGPARADGRRRPQSEGCPGQLGDVCRLAPCPVKPIPSENCFPCGQILRIIHVGP